MCIKSGVGSSSRFPFTVWTNRQINRQTRLNAQTTPAAMPAWVIRLKTNCDYYAKNPTD